MDDNPSIAANISILSFPESIESSNSQDLIYNFNLSPYYCYCSFRQVKDELNDRYSLTVTDSLTSTLSLTHSLLLTHSLTHSPFYSHRKYHQQSIVLVSTHSFGYLFTQILSRLNIVFKDIPLFDSLLNPSSMNEKSLVSIDNSNGLSLTHYYSLTHSL